MSTDGRTDGRTDEPKTIVPSDLRWGTKKRSMLPEHVADWILSSK